MTRAIWITDPHFNFVGDPEVLKFALEVTAQNPEVVVITGDIAEARSVERYLGYLEDIILAPVYFVLGNHDFYGSSLHEVWEQTRKGSEARERVKWLSLEPEPVRINATTALVGDDGWYDALNGNPFTTTVGLADFDYIKDFRDRDRYTRIAKFQWLADISVQRAKPKLIKAFDELGYNKAVFATHVAPYAGAAWHMGKPSDANWQPYFSSKSMGDMLNEVMNARPDKELLVLCGHSHGAGIYDPRPNIQVETGGAKYHHPAWMFKPL